MKEFFGLVYKATNRVNGKVYVGQTIHKLKERRRSHEYEVKLKRFDTYFYRALRKHGYENFNWKIIECCNSEEELNLAEEWYIRYYKTFVGFNYCCGYNSTLGGQNRNNIKTYKDKLCGLCKTLFVPTSGNQVYCEACHVLAKKKRDKKQWKNRNRKRYNYREYIKYCKICDKKFKTYYTKKIYCGSEKCELERQRKKSVRAEKKRKQQRHERKCYM